MWKIFLLLVAIKSSYATYIILGNCTVPTSPCIHQIYGVTSANDTIQVVNKPANYVDGTVTWLRTDGSSTLTVYPQNLLKTFPNVTTLELVNNSMTTLTTNTFGDCSQLRALRLNNQLFTEIPAGVAQTCINLYTFGFANYRLTYIDPNALYGLTSLSMFYFQDCGVTCIPKGFFSNTPNIEYVSFYSNRLTVIDPSSFKGLPKLNSIFLYYNTIAHVPNFDLTGTATNVTNFLISLIGNPVAAIHPNFLDSVFQPRTIPVKVVVGPSACFAAETTIENANWTSAKTNQFLSCTNSWTSAMDTEPLNCIHSGTTTSTTTTTTTTLAPVTQPPTTLAPVTQPPTTLAPVTQPPTTLAPVTQPPTTLPPQTSTTTLPPTTNAPGSCSSDKICRYYLDYLDRYTCVLDGVDGTLTSISGSHISSLFTNLNVTRVYFKNSFLSRIPKVLFSTFVNLDFLSVANCSLGMITNATITVCGKLSYLDARFNEIYHVSSGAFKSCTSLQVIDFTGNPIEKLNTDIFTFDPSLKKVILNTNY